jgi:hypothetical protein
MAEEDLSRPAFRYSSSGRRPERLNQSRNVNAPLQLLRGWAAGTLGLPGDIEGLVRMLPGIQNETPVLPTSDFYREWLPGYDERPAARAMSGLGALTGGMGATNVARAGLGAVKRATDVNAIRDYVRAAQGVSGMPGAAVIKPKGGNWLAGAQSPEASVQRLKGSSAYVGMAPEQLEAANASDAALNRWIDKKLAGYIRNEMGTPEDPVRALAERGVLHFEPQMAVLPSDTAFARTAAGYPRHGVAKSQLATDWEVLADAPIETHRAGKLIDPEYADKAYGRRDEAAAAFLRDNPWLAKVPPETPVYTVYPGSTVRNENLGFGHLVDELRNAVNPESGLPRELLWKYSDLDKVTVPQAVQRVSDINKWRAAQKAEADLARAMNPATQVFKEYPEQGYRLVELKMPKDLPKGWKKRGKTLVGPNGERALEGSSSDPRYKILEDALKYEGEVMGHCVGGYCPDVVEGRSRIFSLRDAKGQPHVTIETNPKGTRTVPEGDEDALVREAEEAAWSVKDDGDERAIEDIYEEIYDELLQERFPVSELDDIVQIKGKANRAPKEEYLPFVQDFVRSGQWGRVGDLGNTGLMQLPDKRFITKQQFDEAIQRLTGEGEPSVNAEWFQRQIARDPSWWENARGAFEGFARGGAVTAPPRPAQYDPARIDALAAELLAA